MMRATMIAGALAAAVYGLSSSAEAAPAYATANAPIFSGPGNEYPVVGQIGYNQFVDVNGCLGDYSWCDVTSGPSRGWVYAGALSDPNQGGATLEYGPQLGFPIVGFAFGDYWDRNYHDRPFYADRGRWENHWRDHREDHGDRGHGDHRGGDGDRGR